LLNHKDKEEEEMGELGVVAGRKKWKKEEQIRKNLVF
jgi:hypothetical protein